MANGQLPLTVPGHHPSSKIKTTKMAILASLLFWLAASQIGAFTLTFPSMKNSNTQCRLDFLAAVSSDIQHHNDEDASIAATTSPKPHKRRERYSGRYPKNFKHKYKEMQGDEETVAKHSGVG